MTVMIDVKWAESRPARQSFVEAGGRANIEQ